MKLIYIFLMTSFFVSCAGKALNTNRSIAEDYKSDKQKDSKSKKDKLLQDQKDGILFEPERFQRYEYR